MKKNESGHNRRIAAERLGKRAEFLAAAYLMLKGYRIVARRYKTKLGEIDIIARKGDLISVAEVKARPTVREAADAVGYESQRRINHAADLWLSKQRDHANLSVRFDIIAICPWRWPVHLKDAF